MSNNSLVLLDCADPHARNNEASCYCKFGENDKNRKPEILARLGRPNVLDFAWGSCWLEKKKMLAVQCGDGFTYFHDLTTFKEKRKRFQTVLDGIGISMCAPVVATKDENVLIAGGGSTVNCFLLSEDPTAVEDRLLLEVDLLEFDQTGEGNYLALDINPVDDSQIVCGGTAIVHLLKLELDTSSSTSSSYEILRKFHYPSTSGGDILSLKFSVDGSRIVGSSQFRVIVSDLYNDEEQEQQKQGKGYTIIDVRKAASSEPEQGFTSNQFWFVRFSQDCSSILIAPDSSKSAALLDISSSKKSSIVPKVTAVYTHSDDAGGIFDAQFSDREDFVLLLGRSASLTLHKAKTGERLWCLKLGSFQAYSMTASSSRDTFAVCTDSQSEEAKKASVVVVKVPQMRNRYEARRPCVLIKFKGKGKLAQDAFEVWDIFVLSTLFM